MNTCPPVYECRGKERNLRYPCYAELKMDGEYHAFIDGTLVNKFGKQRQLPLILDELAPLCSEFIGELYYGTGKSGSLYELLANRASPTLTFGVFDILSHKGIDTRHLLYTQRRDILNGLLPEPKEHVRLIRNTRVADKKHLNVVFEDVVEGGYEGIVVKNGDSILVSPSTRWVKMKYKETADLTVTCIDPTRERIEVRVNDQRTCGVKVIPRFKRMLKVGDIVEIEHQGVLSNGGLRHPVYIRHRPDKKEADTL